ncbi:cellulase family glycosylhydrolase [Christiangramia salexigens]|uniref:Glycoside hydrolase family 5 domain-containing protein n=1 Tax=Christiangramia salexigens TaxID=1913577 RepID=A0A1L3J225_9FLAO|nr:cellulase family glycosylhydrolase [Christiangramia salexigens]APG59175.1 hypothetical protein LPB144_01580 [Christiangramia salexigens]
MISKKLLASLFILVISGLNLQAQNSTKGDVYVDKNGVMKWGNTHEEVKGFGVNYSVPFAHAYRSAEKMGLNIKAEIDKDIYHFTRLNFDLYRLHVWDTEISDEEGNLIENEHLETFDYLLKQLKDRGINFVITPIAYWGNGWPEPDEDTPGFSDKYGKENSLTNPEAIKAQQNYLAQFLNHFNPYTGIAYKNEPNLIAFEISNEPHHRGTPNEVKGFIKKMVRSMRSTGTKKPIFYNVTHSVHLAETYFDSGIQGGTFQWYPTGLGFKQELEGNLLPNVNDYNIPFDDVIQKKNAAKLVYEFDAADVNKSYMYPAMARSFRQAGIQIGTHFAYYPTYLAYANTEYDTHYMNLNYTPHKALGLMIASEIFHKLPMGEDLGVYPENLEFGDFRIQYEGDLATYNSGDKFIYTNTNDIEPTEISKLKEIAGHGSSRIIKYEGKGAYFLDKLDNGVWRLEVMPDPILIQNPFGSNSLSKIVSVISWKSNPMEITIPDLGTHFQVSALNMANEFSPEVNGKKFHIKPGTYLVKAAERKFDLANLSEDRVQSLKAFVAKENTVDATYAVHEPVQVSNEGETLIIEASLVSNKEIEKAEVWFKNGNIYDSVELRPQNNYDYTAKVPDTLLQNGFLEYRIIITTNEGKFTFPGSVKGSPKDWDFHSSEVYTTRILGKTAPIYIFNASEDSDKVVRQWKAKNNVVPLAGNKAEFQIKLDGLFNMDIENKNAKPVNDYSFRYNLTKKTGNRALNSKSKLILTGRALEGKNEVIQVALVMKNGASFGKLIELTREVKDIEIDMNDLKAVRTVTLPRPYPSFLPYYFDHSYKGELKLDEVESVQISIGPGIEEENLQKSHAIGVRSIRLE